MLNKIMESQVKRAGSKQFYINLDQKNNSFEECLCRKILKLFAVAIACIYGFVLNKLIGP